MPGMVIWCWEREREREREEVGSGVLVKIRHLVR
jgi:hypothetical protein